MGEATGEGADELRGIENVIGSQYDDRLYGDAGANLLQGGGGDDGLFGGVDAVEDTLSGGDGADRLLFYHDGTHSDALPLTHGIEMVDTSDATIGFRDSAGNWTDAEVHIVDQALDRIQDRTGNTKLLKMKGMFAQELMFLRGGDGSRITCNPDGTWTGGVFTAQNHNDGRITLYDRTFFNTTFNTTVSCPAGTSSTESPKPAARSMQTIIKEIGHNFDSENTARVPYTSMTYWERFKRLSGWRFVNTNGGTWLRWSSATFARADYGHGHPKADWATAFSAYFMRDDYDDHDGAPRLALGYKAIPSKIALIDEMDRDTLQLIRCSLSDFPSQ